MSSRASALRPQHATASLQQSIRFSALLFLLFFLGHPFSSAQVSASLSGVVTDQSGAAITGAMITARNVDTDLTRDTSTDQAGRYQIFALPLGQYELRVKKDGFAEAIRTGIRLVVGQDARVDLALKVGAVSEEVKVNGDAAVVSVTTQDISGLVGEQQVKDLPLNGRSYDLLLTLNPRHRQFHRGKNGRNRSIEFDQRK